LSVIDDNCRFLAASLAALLVSEVPRRITATRNDGVAHGQYLIAYSINAEGISGKEPAREDCPAYGKSGFRY
jgi:hypothetical protein